MSSREHIERALGPVADYDYRNDHYDIVRQVNDIPDEPLIRGRLTTWGFEPEGQDVTRMDHDWSQLERALKLAREAAAMAFEANAYHSSEADIPYAPFVLRAPGSDEVCSRVSAALGVPDGLLSAEDIEAPASENLFFGEDAIDEGLEEYFSAEEIEVYRKINEMMAAELSELSRLSCTDEVVVAPVLFVGTLGDYVVGIWSHRVFT